LFAKSITKNRNRLAFVVWEIFKKKWEGVAEIWTFFFVFCAAVFSSTAAPKNDPIDLNWWDSPSLQTILMFFKYSA
jgi:hypothetical protein